MGLAHTNAHRAAFTICDGEIYLICPEYECAIGPATNLSQINKLYRRHIQDHWDSEANVDDLPDFTEFTADMAVGIEAAADMESMEAREMERS